MKSLITSILLLLCLLVPATAPALEVNHYDFHVGDFYYNYIDGGVEVTQPPTSYYSLTSATIPASVTYNGNTYPVTGIGYGAFMQDRELVSVTIPNSVTSIGRLAFFNCGLTNVTISNSVTFIGDGAFAACSGLTSLAVENGNPNYDSREGCNAIIETASNTLIAGCINTFIPNSVTAIGNCAFDGCRGLTSITIPNSVTTIGNEAFYYCEGLTNVTIPNSVTTIGDQAFQYCENLTSMTIGNAVATIGDNAFCACKGLTSVTIPNSVITIGKGGFNGCEGLTSVAIGNSVTSIGDHAFVDCISLASITVASGNTTYDSRDNCNAIIETSSNTLIAGCKNTVIPNTVIAIGDYAFADCSYLTNVNIPNSVTSIGTWAFYRCVRLASVTIGNSVTTINEGAFLLCTSMTSLSIGNSVTTIGKQAFESCRSLPSVDIPNSVTTISDQAFQGCVELTRASIGNSVTTIGRRAFANCSKLTSATIPNSVTAIGEEVFYNCESLASVAIGTSVQSISENVFAYCKNLTRIVVESGNTTFDSRDNCNAIVETATNTLFAGCKATVIPNSVTAIGRKAFEFCRDMTSVTIPNSVTTIGDQAFRGCWELANITVPNSVIAIGYDAFAATAWFENQPDGLVYAGLVAYKYKGMMQDDTSIIINDGTLGIAGGAFSGYRGLTSITIPNTVLTIGYAAFASCTGLTSVTIPSSVISIGSMAFESCDGLTRLVVESENTTYDSRNYCNAIIETASNTLIAGCKNTIIPNTVTTIGYGAFFFCVGPSSIFIPASVTTIGEEAFMYCDARTVTIPNSVTSIGDWAFCGCYELTDVYCYITDLSNVSVGYNSFSKFLTTDYSERTLHVTLGTADAYRTNENWYPYFGRIVEDIIPDYLPGDVNGDGEVNIADINALMDIILGDEADAVTMLRADVNSDGETNIADINALIDIILGGGVPAPDNHEWVDLGLPSGTLWATMNVGANNPEDYGHFFAWGEIAPKDVYTWETYKWCDGSGYMLTKYCTDSLSGRVDNKAFLDLRDDAAYVNWGRSWRTPSKEQIQELCEVCTSEWTTVNDVNGMLITGPNGSTMFLPAAGSCWDSSIDEQGSCGLYWANTIYSLSPSLACGLGFYPGQMNWYWGNSRCLGYSIRAVRYNHN